MPKQPTRRSLSARIGAPFVYTGARTRDISFPLGGIGTGCIGLAGNGRLVDWEIFNRPNKGSFNGLSHFAVRAERDGKVLDARVLNSDYEGSCTGDFAIRNNLMGGFGFGVSRQTLAGMPHFRDATFTGAFPIAEIAFQDESFPGAVKLTAFNPFIPLNDRDSGLPAAFFEIEVANTTRRPLRYAVAATLRNPLPEHQLHTVVREPGLTALRLASSGPKPDDPAFGDLTLATGAARAQAQPYWFRGGWMDNLEIFWRDFTSPRPLPERTYPAEQAGADNHGTLLVPFRLAPGKTARARFVIAWNFPNCENYWNPPPAKRAGEGGGGCEPKRTWKNYYATLWPDSAASAAYALRDWERLERETRLFRDALFASTLPPAVLDAVSANLSILKSPTVMRLEDGTFYGWEGCAAAAGSCEGSCTHVWNYAQALPFLFPALERSMREADYRYNLRADGGMPFRLQLPLGVGPASWCRPCADGQFGGVIKVYREWKISGDTGWLGKVWPSVKAALEYAWRPDNKDRWDPDKSGVLHGRQHHTLDMELFGPNAWLSGFYLAALKAAAELARAMDEPESAREYEAIFARGREWVEKNLFNGEYYQQAINLADRGQLAKYDTDDDHSVWKYWNDEHRELKYQIGDGCATDQLLAQWFAGLCGLGRVFDEARSRAALAAVFRHNFRPSMRAVANTWRVFALNDEAGLVICSWPEGRKRPSIPLTYGPETMTGFEYAAACAMIQHGLVREGLAVVKAVRGRYTGERRNPWNEIECGSNYARAMASYGLVPALSGFEFDLTRGMLGFFPALKRRPFACFWAVDGAWGLVEIGGRRIVLKVLHGVIRLRVLRSRLFAGARAVKASVGRRTLVASVGPEAAVFGDGVALKAGDPLVAEAVR